ncbi:MAG: DUF86 domain-containing protein [Candidatus Latescibacterota bacterium]|nr:MAG: DUF86 domain-containing protein [Candidatus Latescibacterota bacterium]
MAPDLIGRFARLERALQKLDRLGSERSVEEYLKDDDLQDIVERNFQVAIEALIDLANHLVSVRAYRKPESNVDVFSVLEEEGVIDADLAGRMADWVRFRNILIHDYVMVDQRKVYRFLRELDDLRTMACILARHLEL